MVLKFCHTLFLTLKKKHFNLKFKILFISQVYQKHVRLQLLQEKYWLILL